jgi:hypothetical protein
MNFASHFTPSVAAGAVLAAAMLVVFGGAEGADPAASIRALAPAQERDPPQGRASAFADSGRGHRVARAAGSTRVVEMRGGVRQRATGPADVQAREAALR